MRNVILLAIAQMLASSGLTVVVILGGILGAQMAPRASLATVPLSLAVVATALSTIPAAVLMRNIGRRAGFVLGALLGAAGGLVAARAVVTSDFTLFCASSVLLGSSMAFTQQYRFAAVESVEPEQYSRAISYVLIGGLGAALVNPQLALAARWLIPGADYAGSFVAVSALYVAAIPVLWGLRSPPVRQLVEGTTRRSVGELVALPHFRLAVFASAIAYAVMSFLMTAAPLSMHTVDHHDVKVTTWVIQSHVLAMYLPSLFTGHLIARWGEQRIMMGGGVLLALCAAVSLHGHHLMHYWSGMVLLGIGWNFLFVAGTTLLSRSVAPADRHRAQAMNDFTVFGSQACASLLAGVALHQFGWQLLNAATLPLLAVMIVAASRLRTKQFSTIPEPLSGVPGRDR